MSDLAENPNRGRVVGLLIPEFPGQTHIFFLREIERLERMGVGCVLFSTRRPAKSIAVHAGTEKMAVKTYYLYPPGVGRLFSGVLAVLRAGPTKLCRFASAVGRAEGLGMKGRLRMAALAVAAHEVAARAKALGCRHLHIHSCGDSALIGVAAKRLFGLTYSVTLHGPLEDYGPGQPTKWRDADFAIVITQRIREQVETTLGGDRPEAIYLAPMGVDLEKWRRDEPYVPWAGDGDLRITSCGRLHESKGHHTLIDAVKRLRDRGIPAVADIYGAENVDLGYRPRLESQIASLGLRDAVRLHGAVDEETLLAAELESHVFVLASRAEPLGVAIMEAMALEMPLVSTDAGGVPELVCGGRHGLLVPPGDADALAEAVAEIAQDAALAAGLGRAARARVEAEFHSGRSAEAIVQGFDELEERLSL